MASNPFACKNKEASRQEIWTMLSSLSMPSKSHVLILPGSHPYEIEVLVKLGYAMPKVLCVEQNPAVLANLTRRLKGSPAPPRENFLRMKLSEAVTVLQERQISLDAAHLDFCANVEGDKNMLSEIHAFIKSGVLARSGHLTISWLRGREHDVNAVRGKALIAKPSKLIPKEMSLADQGRLRYIYEAVGMKVTVVASGQYYNTITYNPMAWIIIRLLSVAPTENIPMFRSKTRQWKGKA